MIHSFPFRITLADWLPAALAIGMALGACATVLGAAPDSALENPGFETQDDQAQPTGWVFPAILQEAGYRLRRDRDAMVGEYCALLDATSVTSDDRRFGNLMQSIDATPFRGKRVRFKAAVRTGNLSGEGRAQLWFRVDRRPVGGQNRVGAFDNMQDRPIRDSQWKYYEIVGHVDQDAVRIHVGLLVLGGGKAWIDDASLMVVSDATSTTGQAMARAVGALPDPPQPVFVPWLMLPVLAVMLFVLSQTKSSVQRIAFRFTCAYWLLYFLPAPIGSVLPMYGYRVQQLYESQVDQVVRWTAANVLGIQKTLIAPNGSGDTTFDYVRLLVCFCLAIIVALLWSAVDRRKSEHQWLNDLLRSYLRYVLAFIMLGYGLAKLSSTYNQFPAPEVDQLLKPYGESSPMNLLWTFMGSSRAYTCFCGLGEVLGALLLVWRRTTTLGALVTAGVMLNVVLLNFSYDVPVKQFSSHLLVAALFVTPPDVPRLANLLIWNRPTAAAALTSPFLGAKTIWIQRVLKGAVLAMAIGLPLYGVAMREFSGRAPTVPQPTFFGSYEVETFTRGGQPVEPLLTDSTRWRTVSLRRYARFGGGQTPRDMILVSMMDKTMIASSVTVAADGKSLRQGQTPMLPPVLSMRAEGEDHLVVSGTAQGKPIQVRLRRLRREDFLLVNRGFRWINEYPFNR